MSAKIYTLKDSFGNQILPRTTSKAVYTEDGYILDDKLADIQNTANKASNIATNAVSEHNSDTSAHSDIRTAVSNAATAAANAQTTADGKMNYNANIVQYASNALKTLGGTAVDVGGAKIATGSYTGNGNYGSSNPNSLTFNFTPKFLIIHTPSGGGGTANPWFKAMLSLSHVGTSFATCGGGDNYSGQVASGSIQAKFTNTSKLTLQWYSAKGNYSQMNVSGSTYYYIAIG